MRDSADVLTGWRPIETAPKKSREPGAFGGPNILVWNASNLALVWWGNECWMMEMGLDVSRAIDFEPTHWMPLPEPPAP